MTAIVYPGTFDPVTYGHEELMRRAAKIFDRVVVGVARGVHKTPLFSIEERVAMVEHAAAGINSSIKVAAVTGLLADFVAQNNITAVLRGMRSVSDFELELQLADVNRRLGKGVETIFMAPDTDHIYVFSQVVREVAMFGGDISNYVNPTVAARLHRKLSAQPGSKQAAG